MCPRGKGDHQTAQEISTLLICSITRLFSSTDSPFFALGTCNTTTPTNRPVKHGSTLALQLVYKKFNWLGCSTSNTRCANSLCPGLYMEGEEWRSCTQNVFQIFRARGHGDVKVGDMVGLYLTRESGNGLIAAQPSVQRVHVPV